MNKIFTPGGLREVVRVELSKAGQNVSDLIQIMQTTQKENPEKVVMGKINDVEIYSFPEDLKNEGDYSSILKERYEKEDDRLTEIQISEFNARNRK